MITKPLYPKQFFISEIMWITDQQITSLFAAPWGSEQKDDATAQQSSSNALLPEIETLFLVLREKKNLSKPQMK